MKWVVIFLIGMAVGKFVYIVIFYFAEVKRIFDPLLF